MKRVIVFSILCAMLNIKSFTQNTMSDNKINFYAGYDLGEMAFNKFQNFAGELGVKFKNDHGIRLTYMNVKLTEDHLSSGFAGAVDGENVSGHWLGYDLIYDIPIYRFKKKGMNIYGNIAAGYHSQSYQHTINEESFEHKTNTAGFGIGFRESNMFKVRGLYLNFHVPLRFYFNTLEETQLGNSIINEIKWEQTLHFFVGYEF